MLNSDYRDILSAFADAEVEYLLVGAHALAAHGHPRATGDIDLWVKPSAGNAARVMQALRQFGAPLGQVSREYFAQPDVVFQIGVAPRRIDVMTSVEAIAFEDAWPERLEVNLEGIPVPVIGRADFIPAPLAGLGRNNVLASEVHSECHTDSQGVTRFTF
ncbi:MAG: hypothetical protein BRD52_01445 [Bacteroidetes bacterium SW_4_67_19]|nr:MAG: hypothetical protein BRD52_01445 [Bacteroidetes bacterium SW_4_67_19]